MVVDKIQFPVGCWTKGFISSLAVGWSLPQFPTHGLLHRAAWRMAASFHPDEQVREQQGVGKTGASVFLWPNVRGDTPFHLPYFFIHKKQVTSSTTYSRGGDFYKDTRRGSLAAILEAARHSKESILPGHWELKAQVTALYLALAKPWSKFLQ